MNLPGIGEVRSKKILTAFGSVAKAAEADPARIAKVLGVGPEKAEEFSQKFKKLLS